MLSTAADVLSVATAAPWLAVVIVCLVVVFWVYKQGRKATEALEQKTNLALERLEQRLTRSAVSQGERLGDLEERAELERVRRLQLEDELTRRGMDLPCWPPDGDRPRPIPEPGTAQAWSLPPLPSRSRH